MINFLYYIFGTTYSAILNKEKLNTRYKNKINKIKCLKD